jgi:hypothetical protein
LIVELDQATMAQSALVGTLETLGSSHPYTKWDGDKIQACVCDGGFFGPDCSQRFCPKGDDPLTTCAEVPAGGSSTFHQRQTVTLKSSPAVGNNVLTYPAGTTNGFYGSTDTELVGQLVLHFTDNEGEVWTTSAIDITQDDGGSTATDADDAAARIATALKKLPNFKIPDVEVTAGTITNDANEASVVFEVTFRDERTSGEQRLLSCDPLPLGCQTAGCSPMYQQIKSWTTSSFSTNYWAASAGYDVDDGGSAAAAWTSGLTATMDAFITDDSILDNSALPHDQATVRVTLQKDAYSSSSTSTWGHAATASGDDHDVYVNYKAEWDFTSAGTSAFAAPSCPSATQPYCTYRPVPTGYSTRANVNADFPANTGVGFNHVPIGYGLYINLPTNSLAGLVDDNTDETIVIVFNVATVHCEITQSLRSDVMFEDLECSGRGACDHSTGTCTCFEGHYGDHCGLQTILV